MSVDNSELLAFQNQIQALKDDIPEIMDSLAVGEGRYRPDLLGPGQCRPCLCCGAGNPDGRNLDR